MPRWSRRGWAPLAPLALLVLTLGAPASTHLRAPRGSKMPPEAWMSTVTPSENTIPDCTPTTLVLTDISCPQAELIQYWGYPAERHQIRTADGYIFEVHRIPGRRGQFDKADLQAKTPVLLEPGYGATSECMVLRENDELGIN